MFLAKVFDCEHEKDLEDELNDFLDDSNIKIERVCFSTNHFVDNGEQIYSFSCLIIYSNRST